MNNNINHINTSWTFNIQYLSCKDCRHKIKGGEGGLSFFLTEPNKKNTVMEL